MKVLTDHHISAEFAERLADALGTVVKRTYDEGWFRLDNGAQARCFGSPEAGTGAVRSSDQERQDRPEPAFG